MEKTEKWFTPISNATQAEIGLLVTALGIYLEGKTTKEKALATAMLELHSKARDDAREEEVLAAFQRVSDRWSASIPQMEDSVAALRMGNNHMELTLFGVRGAQRRLPPGNLVAMTSMYATLNERLARRLGE